jgi:low affinity Fe/Cu permease
MSQLSSQRGPSPAAHSSHNGPPHHNAAHHNGNHDVFRRFAVKTADAVGHKWAFFTALGVILLWAVLGPKFHFSDTWQLIINTGTTIVTFLMVFLIQNTQNRDAKAIHLKLDELLRGVTGARNRLINLEEWSDEELRALHQQFEHMREEALHRAANRSSHAAHQAVDKTHDAARALDDAAEHVNQTARKAREVADGVNASLDQTIEESRDRDSK